MKTNKATFFQVLRKGLDSVSSRMCQGLSLRPISKRYAEIFASLDIECVQSCCQPLTVGRTTSENESGCFAYADNMGCEKHLWKSPIQTQYPPPECGCAGVSDATQRRRAELRGAQGQTGHADGLHEVVADAESQHGGAGLCEDRPQRDRDKSTNSRGNGCGSWWDVEPGLGRVADGVADRVDSAFRILSEGLI